MIILYNMLDIKFIRENSELVKKAVQNKNSKVDIDALLRLDTERRDLLTKVEVLNQKRNVAAKAKDIEAGKAIKEELAGLDAKLKEMGDRLTVLMQSVPNLPSDDSPIGPDDSFNKVLREVGKIPEFNFQPKEHWELGKDLDLIDTELGAKVTGARFWYMKGDLVLMQWALLQFGFSVLTNEKILARIIKKAGLKVKPKPFIPVAPPYMIRPEVMQKMARLEPKDERYHIESDDLYLIGSAEHTLGPMHMDSVLPEVVLPVRYAAYSPAYRREAGTYGKDMKGILRGHQFDKLEMESFALPEQGLAEQDFFVAIEEYLMQELGIPYRVIICCTGDQGDPDARHLDIEAWLPGQNKYRETHSADYMTDYQARRLNTKVKRIDGKTEFVHMNDATVFAGRPLIAIMENYQQKDGSIVVPKVLRDYVGKKVIGK